MSRRKRWTRRRGRPRAVPLDDPGRDERRRWQRQAGDVIAALEVENEEEAKRRRLLISLADFLEPGRSERLGAEGAWGVFRAFRELAEQGAPDACPPADLRPLDDPESVNDRPRKESP